MSQAKRILVLYYSLTQQTATVLERIMAELRGAGHALDVQFITPKRAWTLPLDPWRFHVDWAKTWLGMHLTQDLLPLRLSGHYDYVLLGFQPWYLAPSIPVNSFLHSEMAEVFRGKQVFVVMTCRSRWERAFRLAREAILSRGGEVVDALIIQDQAPEPVNLATTYYRLMEGHPPPPDHFMARFPPFGIGADALVVAGDYGRELGRRILLDEVVAQRGWRLVNRRPSTLGY